METKYKPNSRIRGNIHSPIEPKPGKPRKFPWRFDPGDVATVVGWDNQSVKVITGFLHQDFMPHYLVIDDAGLLWKIPQLHMMSA